MFWAVNATSGILIAGAGVSGDGPDQLQNPTGIYLDEQNSLLYVADTSNHRRQLFRLNGSSPHNGTTVAGGNGLGSDSNQLFGPIEV
jgi:sugar lactone lactonase YvrE